MPTRDRKVTQTQPLQKTASIDSPFLTDSNGMSIQVGKGETVKASDPETETQGGESWVWTHIEAGDRKGFIEDRFLAAPTADIPTLPGVSEFSETVGRSRFAQTCYVQALLANSNAAYLYALAFAETGTNWTATKVKTATGSDDVIGVYNYSQQHWDSVLAGNESLSDLEPTEIKFPEAQVIAAAQLAGNAIAKLKTPDGKGANALGLFLTHLFAEDGTNGIKTAQLVLAAEAANKSDPVKTVLDDAYKSKTAQLAALRSQRTGFFKNGDSTTITQFLTVCQGKLDAGYAEVLKLAGEIAEKLKEQIPPDTKAPAPTSNFSGKKITISEDDIDALARVAHSEVRGFAAFGNKQLEGGLAAVVDTILNRTAHKKFPNSIIEVVNQKSQFSAINPLGSWTKLAKASVSNFEFVKNYVLARAKGKESVIGGATHFLNPHISAASALAQWGRHLVKNVIAVYGSDTKRSVHYHGFPPRGKAPADYALTHGGSTSVFSGNGLSMPGVATAIASPEQTVPASWKPKANIDKIICHWTAGAYMASGLDKHHYHILVEGDGHLVRGRFSIKDNEHAGGANYAMHTRRSNSRAIGVSVCCMSKAKEKPFDAGKIPMTKTQWDVMVAVVADLCRTYGIPVTPKTVLGHGEVQEILGIKQKGKWDPLKQPWNAAASKSKVGEKLRAEVSALI